MMIRRSLLTGIVGALFAGPVLASTYTGTIQYLKAVASSTGASYVRISVLTAATTGCSSTPGIYTFDLPTGTVAAQWEAALLDAIAVHRPVQIVGSGTCDAIGETISQLYSIP